MAPACGQPSRCATCPAGCSRLPCMAGAGAGAPVSGVAANRLALAGGGRPAEPPWPVLGSKPCSRRWNSECEKGLPPCSPSTCSISLWGIWEARFKLIIQCRNQQSVDFTCQGCTPPASLVGCPRAPAGAGSGSPARWHCAPAAARSGCHSCTAGSCEARQVALPSARCP